MKKKMVLSLAFVVFAVACSSVSPQKTSETNAAQEGISANSTLQDFPASEGWTNPYPNVYIKVKYNAKGERIGEKLSLLGPDAARWALDHYYKAKVQQLKLTKQSAVSEADQKKAAFELMTTERTIRSLENRATPASQNVEKSAITPQAFCGYAQASATPTTNTYGGAKSQANAQGCTSKHSSTYTTAYADNLNDFDDNVGYNTQYITSYSEARAYSTYAQSCGSYAEASGGDAYDTDTNSSC